MEVSWSRAFDEPVPLPGREPLRTLMEAGEFIASLPKAQQKLPHWHDAAEVLMLVVERGGPAMMARIGMMRALNEGKPAPEPEPRQKRAKVYKVVS